MSDPLQHECGIAFVRLKKDLGYYLQRYETCLWGFQRLYLLMEKQHNRGQDGVGIACVKLDMPAGDAFLSRERTAKRNPIERLFDEALGPARRMSESELNSLDETALKRAFPLLGEVLLGHLRYGTHSGNSSSMCHPYVRRSNVASRSIAIAGNFNLTNSSELFKKLVEYGLHPVGDSDTGVVLEKIGYFVDREHLHLESAMGEGSFANLAGSDLAAEVSRQLDLARVLRRATEQFDGGYVFAGILGNGDSFVCRDPAGIRPGFFIVHDECIAVASERAALSTVFDTDPRDVEPIPPGHALVVKKSGEYSLERFAEQMPLRQCTFERIYFSRGNDPAIYRERKQLGRNLAPRVVDLLGGTTDRAVFGFIPNTSETSYLGLLEAVHEQRQQRAAGDRDDEHPEDQQQGIAHGLEEGGVGEEVIVIRGAGEAAVGLVHQRAGRQQRAGGIGVEQVVAEEGEPDGHAQRHDHPQEQGEDRGCNGDPADRACLLRCHGSNPGGEGKWLPG